MRAEQHHKVEVANTYICIFVLRSGVLVFHCTSLGLASLRPMWPLQWSLYSLHSAPAPKNLRRDISFSRPIIWEYCSWTDEKVHNSFNFIK